VSDALTDLLSEWQRLSLQESAAIRAHDWKTVAACQELKAGLQPGMDNCPNQFPLPKFVRTLVDELTTLESRNRDWLQDQLASLRLEQTELEGSSRNLRRVRNSYGNSGSSHWESYS
jgi:hypothetical protein